MIRMKNNYTKKFLETPIWLIISALVIVYSINIYYGNIYLNSADEGDFGRDLYNFYLVSKGNLPYVDFNWIYGPLAPIIYGLNFNIIGKSILSALNLWYIIYFIICITIYITVKFFSNHFTGFLSVIFFIGYHGFKFNSFNHSIGIIFILLSLLLLYKYLDSNNLKYLYCTSISCFLLTLTKLNMGIAFFTGFFGTLLIISLINKKHIKHICYAGVLSLLLTIVFYGGLLLYTPVDQLTKNFPFFGSDHQYYHLPLIEKFINCENTIISPVVFFNKFASSIYFSISLNIWVFIIILIGITLCFFIYKKEKASKNFTFILTLSLCALFTTHEFIIATSFYSLRYWTLAIIIILFLFIATYLINTYKEKKIFKPIFTILSILFITILSFKYYNIISFNTIKGHYYPHQRAMVKISNIHWLLLTVEAVNYIEKNSKKGEKILTLPYNALYNFITDRDQPSKITEFSYISNITNKDEKNIIANMENNKVNLIMYAIKESDLDSGSGKFGKTHCQKLDKYIKDNYYIDQIYDSKVKDRNLLAPIAFYKRKTPFNNND